MFKEEIVGERRVKVVDEEVVVCAFGSRDAPDPASDANEQDMTTTRDLETVLERKN